MSVEEIANKADMIVSYYAYKILGYFLYFTSHCILECMHVHANSDGKLSEAGSAKFFVRSDGSSKLMNRGQLSDKDINSIQKFIQANYEEMYEVWRISSPNGFYNGQ